MGLIVRKISQNKTEYRMKQAATYLLSSFIDERKGATGAQAVRLLNRSLNIDVWSIQYFSLNGKVRISDSTFLSRSAVR